MKKLLTLLTLLLCVCSGAWADEAILSWNLGTNGAAASGANSITGASGCAAEGFTIAITGNTGKNWSNGNGSISYGGKSYTTLKNSNGAQNTITCPTGMVATKVVFYATSNADAAGKLSEIDGASCSDEVSSLKDYSNPTVIEKDIDSKNSFTFTFSTKQVCFIAVVTYEDASKTKSSLTFASTSGTADIADGFALPALTATPNVSAITDHITYTSSNTAVATVDESGVVTLKAKGTTVIKASFAGDATYTKSEAAFTLTVTDRNNPAFGYTEELDEDAKTLAARALSEIDNVTLTQIFGSNITNDASTSTTVYLNGTAYTNTSSWRKTQKDTYEEQYVGYDVTIASGYALDLTNVEARILIADDTRYYWYVQILDANGTELYKTSKDKETTKASSASLSDNLSLTNLSGKISVRLYVKQSGTAKRFSIEKLLLEGTTKVDTRPTYTVTTSVTPVGAGTVTPGSEDAFVEGSNVVLTATANTGYKFVKWTVDEADVVGNPYTITSIAANHTAVATFEALPVITFAKGEGTGTAPSVDYVEAGSYTLPYAYFLYKAGATLTGWSDGVNTYAPGSSYTVSGDVTFTPVFTDNTVALGDATTTVNWTFARNAGAPLLNCEGSEMDYVQHVTIDGTMYDAVMHVNTKTDAGISGSKGKLNNTSDASRAQVNKGTVFTIPAVKGMIVTVTYTYGSPAVDAFTFDGNNADAVDGSAKTLTYTYTGSASTINLIDQGKNLYPSGISVEYPAITSIDVTIASSGLSTLASAKALDFSAVDGLKAYVVSSVTKDAVSLKEVTEIPANTGVILEGTASTKYSVPVAASAEAPAVNKLAAAVAATPVEANDAYILKDGEFHLVTTASTVPAGKAYLPATEVPAGARSLRIVAADETTGIEALESAENAEMSVYNLQGQRVQRLQKGLNIVNGKKVIVK